MNSPYQRALIIANQAHTPKGDLPIEALKQFRDALVTDVVNWLEAEDVLYLDELDAVDVLALRYHVKCTGRTLYYDPKYRFVSWSKHSERYCPYCGPDGKLRIGDQPIKLSIFDELLSQLL